MDVKVEEDIQVVEEDIKVADVKVVDIQVLDQEINLIQAQVPIMDMGVNLDIDQDQEDMDIKDLTEETRDIPATLFKKNI